jgi:hypothetical protein
MKPVIKIEERIAYFQNHLDGIVARMKDSQQAMTGLGIGDPVAGPNLETAMRYFLRWENDLKRRFCRFI